MLTPVFSENNLRNLTPVFYEVADRVSDIWNLTIYITYEIVQLVDGISRRVTNNAQDLDMLDWMGRAALEIFGQAGLGHSFDPLTSDDASDPYTMAAKAYLCVHGAPDSRVFQVADDIVIVHYRSRRSWWQCGKPVRS